jgi:hypothetical protein
VIYFFRGEPKILGALLGALGPLASKIEMKNTNPMDSHGEVLRGEFDQELEWQKLDLLSIFGEYVFYSEEAIVKFPLVLDSKHILAMELPARVIHADQERIWSNT